MATLVGKNEDNVLVEFTKEEFDLIMYRMVTTRRDPISGISFPPECVKLLKKAYYKLKQELEEPNGS